MNSNIYERIAIYCEKHDLFRRGDRVVVGLSGGADSVFLLYALYKLKERWDLQLFAAHVNHGIRGQEAERDQNYAIKFAEGLGISCHVYKADIPKLAQKEHLSEEEAGRKFRYQCFEECCLEKGASCVAVAHHQEDQAETVLFQMLRGSSLRGLGGMRPKRERIVRPLLELSRAEIVEELERQEIAYCVDSTNEEDSYTRNFIRHQVIPLLQEKVQPEATAHIAETAADLREVAEYLEMQTEALFQTMVTRENGGLVLSAKEFIDTHPVMRRELVLRMVEELAGQRKDITRRHIQAVCELYLGETGKSLVLPYSLCAEKTYDTAVLYIKQSGVKVQAVEKQTGSLAWNQLYRLTGPEGREFTVFFEKKENKNLSVNYEKNYCTKCFDYDKMVGMPIFRRPEPGDFLWLDRTGKRKKLSRFFIDEKIPIQQRRETIVLAEGSHVLWVPLLNRCSAYYYVTESTKEIVCTHPISCDKSDCKLPEKGGYHERDYT